jgi:hypothetical protein
MQNQANTLSPARVEGNRMLRDVGCSSRSTLLDDVLLVNSAFRCELRSLTQCFH